MYVNHVPLGGQFETVAQSNLWFFVIICRAWEIVKRVFIPYPRKIRESNISFILLPFEAAMTMWHLFTDCRVNWMKILRSKSWLESVTYQRCLLPPPSLWSSSTPETWVNFYQTTRRNNPEDSHLHTRRRENLKSHRSGPASYSEHPHLVFISVSV
jgi:hypothetical protein